MEFRRSRGQGINAAVPRSGKPPPFSFHLLAESVGLRIGQSIGAGIRRGFDAEHAKPEAPTTDRALEEVRREFKATRKRIAQLEARALRRTKELGDMRAKVPTPVRRDAAQRRPGPSSEKTASADRISAESLPPELEPGAPVEFQDGKRRAKGSLLTVDQDTNEVVVLDLETNAVLRLQSSAVRACPSPRSKSDPRSTLAL